MINKVHILISIIIFFTLVNSCETLKTSATNITRSYINSHKPDIKIKNTSITDIKLTEMSVNVLMEIKNNLDFEIPISRIKVDLVNTKGNIFATAISIDKLNIPANSTKDINLKFNAKYIDIFFTAYDSIKSKSFSCDANITLMFKVYDMVFEYSYNKKLKFNE